MSRYRILTGAELKQELAILPDWHLNGQQIEVSYVLSDFRTTIGFILQIAFAAEALDHHPEIINSYNKVTLRLSTHDAGDTVTHLDIELAKRISAIYKAVS